MAKVTMPKYLLVFLMLPWICIGMTIGVVYIGIAAGFAGATEIINNILKKGE